VGEKKKIEHHRNKTAPELTIDDVKLKIKAIGSMHADELGGGKVKVKLSRNKSWRLRG
jgi:hypothetical protein